MEPVSVGVIAAALLAKALNRVEDGVIDRGVAVARKAIEALRRRFSRERDGLLDELRVIAEQIEGAGVRIGDIRQEAEGANIAQVAGNPGSQISIDQGASPPPRD